MKKFLTTALFVLIGLTIFPQTQAYLTISVKAGNIPLEGVTVTYTCNWVSNLGNWSSWNSGLTDVNGELITPTGENLNNVTVEVTNVPWALQQLYGNTFYPAQHTFASLTQHEIIEFNTEQTSPIINILQPNSGNISISSGSSVPFEVDVTVGGGFSIDTVVFYLDGQLMPAIISSGSIYVPQTAWVPSTLDFYQNHTLVVSSTSSNMAVSTEDIIFYLDCSGTNCPNQLPVISWISPVPTTVNQSGGLVPLDIILSIVDFDGSVLSAKINIDGSSNNLLPGSNNTY
ncbi:MAG: hypothetical protein U9R19_12330, partial [Bacteroidota bacterium]|nr:hypothetical protein [Bacteroidota bacterium]